MMNPKERVLEITLQNSIGFRVLGSDLRWRWTEQLGQKCSHNGKEDRDSDECILQLLLLLQQR
jgi:hypothetical protein